MLLCETITDKRVTYYVDGKRVSYDKFDMIKIMARMYGALDCFQTTISKRGDIRHYYQARY